MATLTQEQTAAYKLATTTKEVRRGHVDIHSSFEYVE